MLITFLMLGRTNERPYIFFHSWKFEVELHDKCFKPSGTTTIFFIGLAKFNFSKLVEI